MNAGEAVVEWLFSEQLKVDSEWSVRTPAGFKMVGGSTLSDS